MQKLIFRLLFIGTITMAFIVSKTGATLKTAETPHGIIDLELAYNVSKVNKIIKAWSPSDINPINNIEAAKANTWWDFLFLVCYASFLFTFCKKISRTYKTGSITSKAGVLFANSILIAGLLDAIENIGMLKSLSGHIGEGVALFTATASFIKWLLVICCLSFILISFPRAVYLQLNNKKN